MSPAIPTLGIARAALLTAVTVMNLASTAIMCLAITFGSGGRFQAVLIGLNGFACLLPAAYWLHRIVFEGEYLFFRSMVVFGLLSLIGFASVITVLIRNDEQEGMALIRDFAMLDHPARMEKSSIALAMLSTLFSIIGCLVAYTGWMSQKAERNPANMGSNMTTSAATRQMNSRPVQFYPINVLESIPVPPADLRKGNRVAYL